ncbi:hypothetical protein Hanom_Chr15g01355731 [Helianthus anomalus]
MSNTDSNNGGTLDCCTMRSFNFTFTVSNEFPYDGGPRKWQFGNERTSINSYACVQNLQQTPKSGSKLQQKQKQNN